jgi:MarR family transcriptional regulator, lower aerobic nicotinate degradation pathway regulator
MPVATMPNKPPYVLDDQIGYILRRATQRHLVIFSETIPGLTTTQFAVLARLAELGPLSQNLLGRETAMDAATIKGVVDRLAKQDMVTTTTDSSDRRRLSVSLTEHGQAQFSQTRDAAIAVSQATLAPLSAPERAVLLALLARLA